MVATLSAEVTAFVLVTVAFGGTVKGVAGFGYGIAGTSVLASVLEPSAAVAVMIFPMLVANLSLVPEVDRSEIASCVSRFWLYLAGAVVGTVAGMFALGYVPVPPLKLGIGVMTVGYALLRQPFFEVPGLSGLKELCFTEGSLTKAALGLVSGAVFGATNVGVQVVAYLDSLDLDRPTFVGVLSMVLVGVSTVRVGVALLLGLYGTSGLLGVSAVAAVPGAVGVFAGSSVRRRLPDSACEGVAVALLSVIGIRLALAGGGVL